eukprot:11411603-Prorocentrum_lima.AAC.1
MTSSLVGSEMCIRDRKRRQHQHPSRRSEKATTCGKYASCEPPRILFAPVSYTHLTLPTICSV